MISNEASVIIAHRMLSILAKHSRPTFRMFYADYRALFSPVKVPAVKEFPLGETIGFVDVDCSKAIAYLKDRYNFVDSTELREILSEEAEQLQEETHHA
jgi:hypothetical protein